MRSLARVLLVAVLSASLGGGALAQTDESRSTSVFEADSPLFALQHVLDAWEEVLAFDPLDKAAVHTKVADNRLAETAAMIRKNRLDVAADLSAQMAELVEKAAARLAEAKTNAEAETDKARASEKEARIAKVLDRLKANAERQQATLKTVLDKVENPKAKEALEKAMERSAFGLENARKRVGGERGPATPPGRPDAPAGASGAPATGRPESAPGAPATGRPETAPSPAAPTRPSVPPVSPGRP